MDNNNNNNQPFSYTYSAKQQEEIKAIRKKYTVRTEQEDKMETLRRLDASVTGKATAVSMALGIIGALIMGFGMSLVMTDLAVYMHIQQTAAMLIGIITGLVGIVLVSIAYLVYNRIVKKQRAKIAPHILRLADELMK